MHTIKLLLTHYLNISVQAANLSDCRIESNRKNRFGSENRIESNQNFFCPNWNALLTGMQWLGWGCVSVSQAVIGNAAPSCTRA